MGCLLWGNRERKVSWLVGSSVIRPQLELFGCAGAGALLGVMVETRSPFRKV